MEAITENQPPTTDDRPPVTDYVGWKLEQVREALATEQSTRALDLKIIETAAPTRRNLNPTFGAWRVLRVRPIDKSENKLTVELTVARELLAEERVAS